MTLNTLGADPGYTIGRNALAYAARDYGVPREVVPDLPGLSVPRSKTSDGRDYAPRARATSDRDSRLEQPAQRIDAALRVDGFSETGGGEFDLRQVDLGPLRDQACNPPLRGALVARRIVAVEQAQPQRAGTRPSAMNTSSECRFPITSW
jgi:hypothetical protein